MADQARAKKRISLKETFKNLVPELTEENLLWAQVAAAVVVGLVTLSKAPLLSFCPLHIILLVIIK